MLFVFKNVSVPSFSDPTLNRSIPPLRLCISYITCDMAKLLSTFGTTIIIMLAVLLNRKFNSQS